MDLIKPGLYVIPTPIGNLEDITLRSLRYLKDMDLVYAEDTRQTKKLFTHYSISTPLKSYHQHNEHNKVNEIIRALELHQKIGLVSDAGMPGISDPGYLIVKQSIDHNLPVDVLPGASALINGLVISGLPSDRFTFFGFIPPKKGREKKLLELISQTYTSVLYESPHKLLKTLSWFAAHAEEERTIVVARELTKLYQEVIRGSASDCIEYFESKKIKGEFVLIIEGTKRFQKDKDKLKTP